MKIFKKHKVMITAIILLAAILFILMAWQYVYLKKAHSTFENYYTFRGCVQLLERTDDYGLCKISSGQTIKIVKFQNKWYLDGDLPVCWFLNICL